jgi:hypothetical protein
MAETAESVRAALAKVQDNIAGAVRAGASIHDAAVERRGVVDRQLIDLRPATLTSEAAARQYSDLIEERGRLDLVIGMPTS